MPLLLEKAFLGSQFTCLYFGLENQKCLQCPQEARYEANTSGMEKSTEEGGQRTLKNCLFNYFPPVSPANHS